MKRLKAFWGRDRLGVSAALIAFVLSACGGAPASQAADDTSLRVPISIEGEYLMNSEIFYLSRDNTLEWSGANYLSICNLIAELVSKDGGSSETVLNLIIEGEEDGLHSLGGNSRSGSTSLYGVAPGTYFFRVNSTCGGWRLSVKPQW